jgi:hypothetical protein
MRATRLGLLAALTLGLSAGCSANSNAPAKVAGKVTYNGNPLPAGTITFYSEDKGDYSSALMEDGSYTISDLPAGNLMVTVETESYNPKKKGPAYGGSKGAAIDKEYAEAMSKGGGQEGGHGDATKNYVKIPAKYGGKDSSGLTVTLKAGKQMKDFELKD